MDLAAAMQRIKFETHRFARHQYAWFHLNDPRIHWFDVESQSEAEVVEAVRGLLK
jgi:tRNA dimethylallyltransferase